MESLYQDDLHGLVLVKDSVTADSSYVVSSILKLALAESSVLLVTSKHSTAHYSAVLRRLNLNVSKIASEGRFKVLSTSGFSRLDPALDMFLIDLKVLMAAISNDIRILRGENDFHCTVIFDDMLGMLNCFNMPDSHGRKLMPIQIGRALIGLCLSTEGVECTVLVLHEDIAAFHPALTALCHLASTIISIKPLNTGTSAEIEAQLDIFRRKCPSSTARRSSGSSSSMNKSTMGGGMRLGYSEHTVPR